MAITFTIGPESEDYWIGLVKSNIDLTIDQTWFYQTNVTPFAQGGNTFWILRKLAAA